MLGSGPVGGDRVLWRGRCGVAEYAFDQEASLPRWTLPETTEVILTEQRVVYAYTSDPGSDEVSSGEMRWQWPQFLRLQPGRRESNRTRSVAQVQLVCGGADGSFPALVFAGGDLTPPGRADRMANVIRQAVARFRIDHADELGISPGEARMLSRLLIGPEFINHEGGDGQTVSLLGALPVAKPATPDPIRAEVVPDPVVAEPAPQPVVPQPVVSQPVAAAPQPVASESAIPDLAERAARVAALMAEWDGPDQTTDTGGPDSSRGRRPAARLAANAARGRAASAYVRRNPDRGSGGITARVNRSG